MEMTGEQRIAASRDTVWKALNDPNVLEACIPGCQELVKLSDTEMTAVAVIKVGPVTARFQGAVTLSDFDPPNSYRITGEGQGGVAGFAKGSALVRLQEDGGDTLLHYNVSAQIGGKLSQLGGRLIDATAKQLSGAFFKRFAHEIDVQYGGGMDNKKQQQTAASPNSASPSSNGAAHRQAPRRPRPAPAVLDITPGIVRHFKTAGLVVLIAALGLTWYLHGSIVPGITSPLGAQGHISPDFASGVQLIIVAAIGYLFGRLSGTPSRAIQIDREAIDAFADAWSHRREQL